MTISDDSLRIKLSSPLIVNNDSLGLKIRTPLSVSDDSLGLKLNAPLAVINDSLNLKIHAPLAIINDSLSIDTTDVTAGALLKFDGDNWVAGDVTVRATALNTGGQRPFDIRNPFLAIYYIIAMQGVFPSRSTQEGMIGEVRLFAGNFAPRTWAFCEGQLLAISSNTALFSILGTTYGGDGRTTFGLPDLRGRSAVGPGNGPGLRSYRLGQRGGEEYKTLNITNLPIHSHFITTTVN